jgi:hypothetical protein
MMATTITTRIIGAPVQGARDRVATADRHAWTFRANSFAAPSLIAPLTPRPPIRGTRSDRVFT